jgi:hypothetical protein
LFDGSPVTLPDSTSATRPVDLPFDFYDFMSSTSRTECQERISGERTRSPTPSEVHTKSTATSEVLTSDTNPTTVPSDAAVNTANLAALSFAPPYPVLGSAALAENLLAKHQRELQLLAPGDMHSWLEGARPASLVGTAVKDGQPQATRSGCVRSRMSDILAAGALFDETDIISHVYTQKLDM